MACGAVVLKLPVSIGPLDIDYWHVTIFSVNYFTHNVGRFSQSRQPLHYLRNIFFTDYHNHADAIVKDLPHFFFWNLAFFLEQGKYRRPSPIFGGE